MKNNFAVDVVVVVFVVVVAVVFVCGVLLCVLLCFAFRVPSSIMLGQRTKVYLKYVAPLVIIETLFEAKVCFTFDVQVCFFFAKKIGLSFFRLKTKIRNAFQAVRKL